MNVAAELPPDIGHLAALAHQRWKVDPAALALVMDRRRINGPALARQAHVSASLIRNLRNGSYSFTRGATLMVICDVLGVLPEIIATRVKDSAP